MRRATFFSRNHHLPYINHSSNLLSTSVPRKPLSRWPRMTITATAGRNKKIVVILGATGSGKSKLSVDLASRFFPSEIINSDKIQTYSGLDITTNKIPLHERENVPHHLLGEFHPSDSHPVFTPSDFRSLAADTISQILSRQKLPIVAGGSNSFIYALLAEKFNPEIDVFSDSVSDPFNSVFCKQLRYNCCFLWVDVSLPVLNQYLIKRVDDMLHSGMFEELAEYFDDPESDSVSESGLRKAIGVPEFESYFRNNNNKIADDVANRSAYGAAVNAVKDNTCQLAKRQLGKIQRLRDAAGWDLKRIDATAAVTAKLSGETVTDIWEKQVVEPSANIVKRFLME